MLDIWLRENISQYSKHFQLFSLKNTASQLHKTVSYSLVLERARPSARSSAIWLPFTILNLLRNGKDFHLRKIDSSVLWLVVQFWLLGFSGWVGLDNMRTFRGMFLRWAPFSSGLESVWYSCRSWCVFESSLIKLVIFAHLFSPELPHRYISVGLTGISDMDVFLKTFFRL